MRARALAVGVAFSALVALAVAYFTLVLTVGPTAVTVRGRPARLTLQTVASYGHHPFPDWVSYLAKDSRGRWKHTTIFKVPAHTLVTVTIYQYDGQSGLRNPFLAQVRGTKGGAETVNGKTVSVVDPDAAAHTFTVPDVGLSVPLPGIADDAKNQCSVAPCTLAEAHNTIVFSFMSPGRGSYRWQCFVPCAAGFLNGFGGPMQTIGYMDGLIEVA